MTLVLAGANLVDGTFVDVAVQNGLIFSIKPARTHRATDPDCGLTVVDVRSRLLLPALVEPHAHLDKAFLAERLANQTGDLLGAIVAMQNGRPLIGFDDTVERAERAVRLMVSNGTTLIRSHADTTEENGLQSVEALAEVRRRVQGLCALQIVALVGWPITGASGAGSRSLLRDAMHAGADVVGGCPHLDDSPDAANDVLLEIAAEFGRDVDLHTDETLDPAKLALEHLATRVISSGFPHRVTASHCVSLSMQAESRQREVAELVAAARINVVALPHTNLFLQGRDHQQAMPRGVTAVKALRDAGANVCAGADNLQDPFNPMGRGDPLETAALMVMSAHLSPEEALAFVSGNAASALTGHSPHIAVGQPADLVAIAANTIREAIAFASPDRIVVYRGQIVS